MLSYIGADARTGPSAPQIKRLSEQLRLSLT
jgi:hypothetical protein